MTVIEELEQWKNESKRHWVEINIDNGYGASCWEVILGGKGVVHAYEAAFFHYDEEKLSRNIVFAENDEDSWAGLEKTILVGIKRARELDI